MNEVKTLEALAICYGLESISSLNLTNILVEIDCLEVVRLLNDVTLDIFKVSFFIDEAKSWELSPFLVLGQIKICLCTVWRKGPLRSINLPFFFLRTLRSFCGLSL